MQTSLWARAGGRNDASQSVWCVLIPVMMGADCVENDFHEIVRPSSILLGENAPLQPAFQPVTPTCENTTPMHVVYEVTFEGIDPGCEWGVDGNLEPAEGHLTARVEQSRSVDISSFSQICDLGFDFDPYGEDQRLRYDDEVFFMLNDMVLLASDVTQVERLSDVDGFHRFDWSELAGTPINFSNTVPPYCVGEAAGLSTCSVPDAHVDGAVALQLDDALVDDLGEQIIADRRLDFTMVAAGDNDPSRDCTYSTWSFFVAVTAI